MDDPFNISDSESARKLTCGETVLNYQCDSCTPYNNLCGYQIVSFSKKKKKISKFFIWKKDYEEGSSMKGYFVEDFVILGDELMELAKNDKTEHPLALEYIQNEKSKFIFGCTTR